MHTTCRLLVLAVLAASAPDAIAGEVWHVAPAPGPGIDFSGPNAVQFAVDAAADGDVVFVADGVYGVVVVDGKGLSLIGANSSALFALGAAPSETVLTVRNLGPEQTFLIDGFTLFVGTAGAEATVLLRDSEGPVHLQDLFVDSYGAPALLLERSSSVVAVASRFQTNLVPALPDGTPVPGAGVELRDGSALFAYDSIFSGSHGTLVGMGLPTPNAPSPGGPGALLLDSTLSLTGGSLRGGSGGLQFGGPCLTGAQGGAGALLATAGAGSSLLRLEDVELLGGSGYVDVACGVVPMSSAAFEIQSGTVEELPGPERRLQFPSAPAWGSAATLAVRGAPGDLALLFAAGGPGVALDLTGIALHLASAPSPLFVGTLPVGATGEASIVVTLPPAPALGAHFPLALQAFHVDASLTLHTGGPRLAVVH